VNPETTGQPNRSIPRMAGNAGSEARETVGRSHPASRCEQQQHARRERLGEPDRTSNPACIDLRDTLRAFAPQGTHERLLRWHPALDSIDGAGVRIALLDSGLCQSHPALRGARITARDFTRSGAIDDPSGHGTKNAALLVGQGSATNVQAQNPALRGLIPASELLFGKIRHGTLRSGEQTLVRGIRWAATEGADILVLPFGSITRSSLVAREIRRAMASGKLLIFAAAGNRGPTQLLFPARLRDVTAVSAAGRDGAPLDWCCQTSAVACYAPGDAVPAVGPDGFSPFSGSSPATVLAAGVVALWLGYSRRNRGRAAGSG
jgi:subtilisin family serine protease